MNCPGNKSEAMGHLERLELENFKSYKGLQIIGPFKRFTAIIGPNGAGKSNLMDAISFVLGEQTRNLRVRSLKELIHGAPIGKPAANTARVTALYIDDNGIEIKFSRVIAEHRSETKSDWKSVYRINDKVRSAAEYTSKLETIGIFIKAKNFLVFQGAVESIAMKTPKERTQLFEEISRSKEFAGEYEGKKVEMNKAQEETAFSYQKKKSISLEKKEARAEKEEADKYQKLQEEILDAQVQEQLFKLYHNEVMVDSLNDDIKSKQKLLDKEIRTRHNLEEQLKSKKQNSAKFSREMSIIEKKMREKEVELNKKKLLYIKAKEKTSHVLKRLEASKKAQTKAKEINRKHKDQIASLESELSDVTRLAEQFEQEVAEASQGDDLQLMDSQVEEYHKLKEKAGKRTVSLSQQLERVKHDQCTDEEALEQVKMKKQDLITRQQHLREQKSEHEQRVERLDGFIKSNSETLNKLRFDREKLSDEINQAELRYTEFNEALEGVQDKLRDAKVDTQESSRAQRKAEILENLKRLYPGVHGRLIDLCEPVHKRYSIALTKVLGRNMDAIVVDHEKIGKDCIQYIKEQHGDPCTFIPLDTIQAKPTNEALRDIGGSTKLVIDVMKFHNPSIKPALLFACGNALVCDTMDEARSIAFDGPERRKAVSLDGTLYNKSGTISGGASDLKAKAKRWDEKQVETLRRQRDRYLEQIKELVVIRRKSPELQTLQSQIIGLETRLKYSKKDREHTCDKQLAQNEKNDQLISRELQEIEPRMINIQSSIDTRAREMAKLETKINKVEDEVFRDFCRTIGVSNIRQYEEKQLRSQQERAQKRLEFANQVSRLENQLAYERKRDTKVNVKKLAASITADESSITSLQKEENDLLEDSETIETRIGDLKRQHVSLQTEFNEQDVEVKELRKMLGDATKNITSLQKKINAIETEADQKRADRHSLLKACKMENIQIPMVRGSMDDVGDIEESVSSQSSEIGSSTAMMDVDSMSTQGARVLYERESQITVDYSDLDERLKELTDSSEIKVMSQELNAKVIRLQSNLQRINAPNMRAVDKLDDVESRLQQTAASFDQSRLLARKTKQDFERVKKKRCDHFNEAFEHVSTVIDDIYKKLSNNSSAQAFLGAENAEEPYLDGISYNCIAPGKRFRPMDNLSGGEKTVAALALLFSIHSFQPAPFFVLDEIDAALDNTNINRVARYITEHTKNSFQCIVISLKEEFYCHADALIGIYCEPGGECTSSHTLTHDLTQYDTQATPTKQHT